MRLPIRVAVVAAVAILSTGCFQAVGTPQERRDMRNARSVNDGKRLFGIDKLERRVAALEKCECRRPPAQAEEDPLTP